MNITIVLNQPYPHGMACTNRIHNYAKGLQESGHRVEIIIPIALENSSEAKNSIASGQHEGVSFTYAGGSTYRSQSFLRRRVEDTIGPLQAVYHTVRSTEKADAIILVSNRIYHILLFKAATALISAVFIQEKSELPFAFSKETSRLSLFFRKIHNRIIYQFFDGIIVISEQLRSFFAPLIKKSASLLLVPIIVNLEEFDGKSNATPSEKYVAYAGNLSDHKDGVTTLIKAFALIAERHADVQFYLIGKPTAKSEERVNALISEYKLHNRVVLTGYVSRKDLVKYITGASVLALAKPDNEQANFCFPSKLGEYLASTKPVVTTQVGEISSYLTDGDTAFLVEPDDAEAFAEKLDWVLSNPLQAEHVGKQGQALAYEKFSYKKQGKRIADFVQLVSQKH